MTVPQSTPPGLKGSLPAAIVRVIKFEAQVFLLKFTLSPILSLMFVGWLGRGYMRCEAFNCLTIQPVFPMLAQSGKLPL